MRLLLVGAMGRGETWLRQIDRNPAVTLAGCVDVHETHLRTVQSKYNVPEDSCFQDLEVALKAVKPDAVVVASPPQFHPTIAIQSLDAGCPVLTEKPLADTWEGCVAIARQAKRTQLPVMVAQNYRYSRIMQTFARVLSDEVFGPPSQVAIQFFKLEPIASAGFRKSMRYPLVQDMSVHHFDLMRHLLQADAVSVYGKSWNPPWSQFEGDASCVAHLELVSRQDPNRRIQVAYTASNSTHGGHTSWNGEWRVFCPRGTVVLKDDRLILSADEGRDETEVPIDQDGLFDLDWILDEFIQAIASGREPQSSVHDNLNSMAMIFQLIQSFDKGLPMDVAVDL